MNNPPEVPRLKPFTADPEMPPSAAQLRHQSRERIAKLEAELPNEPLLHRGILG